jgi:hypothetical protein
MRPSVSGKSRGPVLPSRRITPACRVDLVAPQREQLADAGACGGQELHHEGRLRRELGDHAGDLLWVGVR